MTSTADGPGFSTVAHPDGLDWLYRPVDAGYCTAESLHDGTLGLHDVDEMNEMLDYRHENEHRARQAAESKR